ncbi:MAG: hypothetical protein LW636_01235 [Planctomycetaceae bacterium]|nr:hypothetical protein [Planctomycetaceae bacterium]
MDSTVRRVTVLIVAIALAACAFALTVPLVTSVRGVGGPLVADAERPMLAALGVFVAFAVVTAIACVVGKLLNAVVGLFVLGTGVGLLAMRTGTSLDFAFGGSSPKLAALELVAWTALVAAASHAVFRVAGPLSDIPPTHEDDIDSPTGAAARKSWLAGLAGIAVAWVAAATATKGQAIGAAVLGGFAAGAVGRMLAPRTQPVYLAAAPVAALALAHAYIAFAMRGELAAGVVDGSFPRLLRIMPIDAAAGSLAGVALGYGFARSFVSEKTD